MSLRIWVALDPEGDDHEERCAMLIAAESPADAEMTWRRSFGYIEPGTACQVTAAEWQWSDVPEPVPTRAGPWDGETLTPHGKLFRGYGFWEEDDPRCDECGELSPAELGMNEVVGFSICPACHARSVAIGETP